MISNGKQSLLAHSEVLESTYIIILYQNEDGKPGCWLELHLMTKLCGQQPQATCDLGT